MTPSKTRQGRLLTSAVLATAIGLAGMAPARATASEASPVMLRSVAAEPAIPGLAADVRLLHHSMLGVAGHPVPATTLLLVPKGTAPAGGWPIVAWEHGTTTPGQKTCAPSQGPELDGGLTRQGFKSDYAWQIGQFLDAGYAVVAPDLEGLGPDATTRYPYYSLSSLARSLVAGVVAARASEPRLSDRWATVGHSDGGHGVLGAEALAGEAVGTTYLGTVASAPYVAIAAHANSFMEEAAKATTPEDVQQKHMLHAFYGVLMSTGLEVVDPAFKPASIMGPDLAEVMPRAQALCSVQAIGAIGAAVKAGGNGFKGLDPRWADQPDMHAFLAANDPAVTPGFTLHKPTLIVQGTADVFVYDRFQTPFVDALKQSGAPVTYKIYDGADHFSVIRRANADVLAFLHQLFSH